MYKILERSFHISDHVATKGGQYNAIENILAKIKADPTAYGIESGDVNVLHPGDKIDLAKIQQILANTKIGTESIYDHANKLPAAVVDGIEKYMPADAKACLDGGAVLNAGPVETASNNDTLVSPTTSRIPSITNTLTGVDPQSLTPQPAVSLEGTNSSLDITLPDSPMTEAESGPVLRSLQSQAAIRNITPFDVSVASTQNVMEFVNTPNPNEGAAKMIDLIRYTQNTSGKLMMPSENVAQYLQRATLSIIRAVPK
jgi:hypothetical protein